MTLLPPVTDSELYYYFAGLLIGALLVTLPSLLRGH